ncbi:DUF4258 domain-containing protein [Gramella sp. KN1008]|uniref:DUF4258 domain-containing protein n=1 Tax=Gramella sp. KN1008 TaxID=2529298 RepID=UPI00103E3A4F|nr:DUF4258 domain-containing protein [Gramella sp. KN1008]TBW29329.1 DUF4258 domain-containing protein [Gramella sp. KN1008]
MKLIHRLAYYGLGLFFGIVILIFFLGGKKASCDYSPNARVLKNIKTKKRTFSDSSLLSFQEYDIDTAVVSSILEDGDVNFDKSLTHKDPCNIYFISGRIESRLLELEIENCDSLATIKQMKIKKDE